MDDREDIADGREGSGGTAEPAELTALPGARATSGRERPVEGGELMALNACARAGTNEPPEVSVPAGDEDTGPSQSI